MSNENKGSGNTGTGNSGETRSLPTNEGTGVGQNPPTTSQMPGFPGGKK